MAGRRNKNGKGWREEGIKKRKKDGKEEGIQGERREGKGKKRKKKKSSAGFKLVRLVLLVFLSVEWEGVVGRIVFTFLPS